MNARFNKKTAYARGVRWIVDNTPLLERIPREAVSQYGSVGVLAAVFDRAASDVAGDVLMMAKGLPLAEAA